MGGGGLQSARTSSSLINLERTRGKRTDRALGALSFSRIWVTSERRYPAIICCSPNPKHTGSVPERHHSCASDTTTVQAVEMGPLSIGGSSAGCLLSPGHISTRAGDADPVRFVHWKPKKHFLSLSNFFFSLRTFLHGPFSGSSLPFPGMNSKSAAFFSSASVEQRGGAVTSPRLLNVGCDVWISRTTCQAGPIMHSEPLLG